MMEQNGLYAEQYDENGYMEQEEEWEREGLLDPAWEKQQKKVSESAFCCYIKGNKPKSSSIYELTHVSDLKMEYCVLIIIECTTIKSEVMRNFLNNIMRYKIEIMEFLL